MAKEYLVLSPSEAVFSLENAGVYLTNFDYPRSHWCELPLIEDEAAKETLKRAIELGIVKKYEKKPVFEERLDFDFPDDRLGRILYSPIKDILDEINRIQVSDACVDLKELENKGKNPEGEPRPAITNALDARYKEIQSSLQTNPNSSKTPRAIDSAGDAQGRLIEVTDAERIAIK